MFGAFLCPYKSGCVSANIAYDTADNPGHSQFHSSHRLSVLHRMDRLTLRLEGILPSLSGGKVQGKAGSDPEIRDGVPHISRSRIPVG